MASPQSRKHSEPLVRFLVKNALIGFTMAVGFVALMLFFNVGNLMTLVVGTDIGILALALLTFMIGLTFASLQMGFAVMFSSNDIGKAGTKADDPLMTRTELARLGLRPIPIRNQNR